MTEEEAIIELEECCTMDYEADHLNAEAVLLDFLDSKGYEKLAEKYRKISEDFWYA